VAGFHDLIDEEKLARYYSCAHKHLALDHVKVENAHLVRTEEEKGEGEKIKGTVVKVIAEK
jgi:hypothetical protein